MVTLAQFSRLLRDARIYLIVYNRLGIFFSYPTGATITGDRHSEHLAMFHKIYNVERTRHSQSVDYGDRAAYLDLHMLSFYVPRVFKVIFRPTYA
jgi:hypothetical protein